MLLITMREEWREVRKIEKRNGIYLVLKPTRVPGEFYRDGRKYTAMGIYNFLDNDVRKEDGYRFCISKELYDDPEFQRIVNKLRITLSKKGLEKRLEERGLLGKIRLQKIIESCD